MDTPFPVLRRMHLFIALSDDELRKLASHFQEVTKQADEYVFRQGDAGDAFYVIQSGRVEVLMTSPISGRTRRLSILVEGDYFGEMALARGRLRSASVKALGPLTLWKLGQADFEAFVIRNQKIRPHLQVALQSRNFARQVRFDWLRETEIVYLVTLRHQVFLLVMMLPPSLAMLAVAAAAGLAVFFQLAATPVLGVIAALFLANVAWMWWTWVDFHNDWYIVTNQRVIDIDKILLIYDSRAEAPLSTVQNTALRTNEFGRQLGYGDVIVNTFSGPITLHDVPNPQATADLILEQVNRVRVQQRMVERDALKTSLKQAIGLEEQPEKPPPPPAPRRSPAGFQGLLSLPGRFGLKIREQQGDTIIYHKHPYVLVRYVGLQLLGIAAVVFVVFLRLFDVLPFPSLWITLAGGLGLILVLAGSALFHYVDWKNDIYMVTSTQIFDVERKPFGAEQRKAANLDAVMNVTYVRPNWLALLLNFGTVTVQTGPGGEMKFFDVFNPLSVQQDIYRRKEARERARAEAAARQRYEELGQYFSAYFEIMEEERKKRERT